MAEGFDWNAAGTAERRALYQVCKAVMAATGMDWPALYAAIFPKAPYTGTDTQSNFRRGRYARTKAAAIHRWIAAYHRETAEATAPELFPPIGNAWEALITRIGIKGRFGIELLDRDTSRLVQRADIVPSEAPRIRLGEAFCFTLEAEAAGTALALQSVRGSWHPMPLGDGGTTLLAIIRPGMQSLPATPEGAPVALAEHQDSGLHRFACVTGPEDQLRPLADIMAGDGSLGTSQLSELTRAVEGSAAIRLHVLDVLFVA